MTHNWKIKKQNYFCFQSKNFLPDKRHPVHRSRYGKYGPRSLYGFSRTACQPIRIENFEKPYNKTVYQHGKMFYIFHNVAQSNTVYRKKFSMLTLSDINTALSQSAFRIYKCYIIYKHKFYNHGKNYVYT